MYVVFDLRESCKFTFTLCPEALIVGIFVCGGEITTFSNVLCTSTISSNVSCILLVDTLVAPFSGLHFNNFGGVVSLGPPCGPLPRLAQPRMVSMQNAIIDNILIVCFIYY